MVEVWGPADHAFQASNYIGYELGRDIASSSREHGPKVHALLGAHGRALRTADEVRHLAMSGFHAGAAARWRSLHELAVLVGVLNSADPEVSRRYLDYARIENLRDLEHYQLHAEALGRKPFDAEEVWRGEQFAAEVVERWGEEMRKRTGGPSRCSLTRRRSPSSTWSRSPAWGTYAPSTGWGTTTSTQGLALASST